MCAIYIPACLAAAAAALLHVCCACACLSVLDVVYPSHDDDYGARCANVVVCAATNVIQLRASDCDGNNVYNVVFNAIHILCAVAFCHSPAFFVFLLLLSHIHVGLFFFLRISFCSLFPSLFFI